MMKRGILVSLVLGLALGTSVRAAAAPPEPSPAAIERADTLHKEGDALFEKKNYERAYVAYIAAFSLKKDYLLAGNLGECEVKLGRYRDAAEHLAIFIRDLPQSEPPELRERAKSLFAEASVRVGKIQVTVPQAGSEIFVDGHLVGKSPITNAIFVDAGEHRVEALMGIELAGQTVDVQAGEERAVALEAAKRPVVEKTVEGKRGVPASVWATGAIALASAGAGMGFSVLAASREEQKENILRELPGDDRNSLCGGAVKPKSCAQVDQLRKERDVFEGVAIGAFVLGAAAGATSLVFAFAPEKPSVMKDMKASAFVTPMGSGFALQGRF